MGRGCYGCFGLQETRNTNALRTRWRELGLPEAALDRSLGAYNPSPVLEEKADRHEAD